MAVLAVVAISAPSAMASGPPLTVPQADLAAAFKCPIDPANATTTPIMFVTGTGASGDQGYLIGQDAFTAYGHPVCYVNFPDFTTADIQISVQYLVYGLRAEFALAHRKVAVIGISQGGLLPRFALTYWPDLRRKVSDVLAAAGTQHGTTVGLGSCSASSPCPPADWQQGAGSKLLRALNSQPDETPGNVSYTTVRSLTDETVQPQSGKHRARRFGAPATSSSRASAPAARPATSARSWTRSRSPPSSTRWPTAERGNAARPGSHAFP